MMANILEAIAPFNWLRIVFIRCNWENLWCPCYLCYIYFYIFFSSVSKEYGLEKYTLLVEICL